MHVSSRFSQICSIIIFFLLMVSSKSRIFFSLLFMITISGLLFVISMSGGKVYGLAWDICKNTFLSLISFFISLVMKLRIESWRHLKRPSFREHWCIVVYINVPQQQNIFFSWMKRPSNDRSRRTIPVQFWEVLHTLKYFFLLLKLKILFFSFFFLHFFFEFLKTLLLD